MLHAQAQSMLYMIMTGSALTDLSCAPIASNSRDRAKDRPSFVILPDALFMPITSPAVTCARTYHHVRGR